MASANASVHRFWRDNNKLDSRAYVEVLPEGLFLRVDDDYYDCELTPEEALALARAIFAEFSS